jgi:very-short-patch-repair endonuclease
MPQALALGAVAELAASRHGAFTRRQAASIGVTKKVVERLMRDGVVRESCPGVLVLRSVEPTWRQRLTVATLACNEAGVAGFESSAVLHEVEGVDGEPVAILLRAPRKILLEGVEVHVGPLIDDDIVEIDGIRCTSVERTLCDLGSVIDEFRTRIAFEWYWRSRGSLTALQAAVDRLHRPGQHGTKVMQELIVESRMKGRPTESALEVRLEAIIGDLEGLVRQYEVYDECGRFVARVDFAIPHLRLAIEAHSRQFHDTPDAVRRDERRHQRLDEAGWRTRYVTSKDMETSSKLRSEIRRLLNSAERPSVPRFS